MRAILVGDIERGGVFAHLYGTVALLPDELSAPSRGFVINRFRGDRSLLGRATAELEDRCGVPTFGVLPHLGQLALDAEDSLALGRRRPRGAARGTAGGLDVAAIRLPRLANFTDLDPLAAEPGVRLRWVALPTRLGDPDLVVLPGTRATVADLQLAPRQWPRRRHRRPPHVVRVAAGDPRHLRRLPDDGGAHRRPRTASSRSERRAPGWAGCPSARSSEPEKLTRLTTATGRDARATDVHGYEIRHGRMHPGPSLLPWFGCRPGTDASTISASAGSGAVLGTTLHGLFEDDDVRSWFLTTVARAPGPGLAALGTLLRRGAGGARSTGSPTRARRTSTSTGDLARWSRAGSRSPSPSSSGAHELHGLVLHVAGLVLNEALDDRAGAEDLDPRVEREGL